MITKFSPILGVCILYNGKIYNLPKPNRHHNVIQEIAKINGVGINGPDKQGFYSKDIAFIGRTFAMQIALQTKQLKRKPGGYTGDELFSEDLW